MYTAWYNDHYHEMSDAGRWFSGCGINLLPPAEWDRRPYRVLIVRLSTARDTADSFTHQLLYQTAVSGEGVFADCAWLPPPEDGELFDRDHIPWLTGVVTKRPALEFDCIALSNSIVQELVNIPTVLRKSGIPAGKKERMSRPDVPLVILGGANSLFTSLLLSDDPVVDMLFVGEEIDRIGEIFSAGRSGKEAGHSKQDFAERLLAVPGCIEPDRPVATRKTHGVLGARQQLCGAPVFAGDDAIGGASLQISEGCPCFCTFCAESWSRKPYREMDADACVRAALAMKTSMGLDRIDLYSFNFNMHAGLRRLLRDLGTIFSSVGLKSQRLDGVAEDPELMKLLHANGKSSITVGIEGISAPLRRRLRKSLDDDTIRTGLVRILETPLRELKLFFLATGWEEEADYDEFRQLTAFIAETMRTVNRQPRIIFSMTPLVRFPFTPLESDPAPDPAVINKIILQCERIVQAKRFEFRSAASMNDYLVSQILVRATDKRVLPALSAAAAETGFVYYRDISDRFAGAFIRHLDDAGCSVAQLLAAPHPGTMLPVAIAVSDRFMDTAREDALATIDRGFCLGTIRSRGTCLSCGACGNDEEREPIVAQRPQAAIRADQLKAHLAEQAKIFEVNLPCRIGQPLTGISRALIAADIARWLMSMDPLFAATYRGYGGSYMEHRFATDRIYGDDIITLRFQERARMRMTSLCDDPDVAGTIQSSWGSNVAVTGMSLSPPEAGRGVELLVSTPWQCDPAKYCAAYSLKYTQVKEGEGGVRFLFSKEALKKRHLSGLLLQRSASGNRINLECGERFNYPEFVKSSISLPADNHFVRVCPEVRFIV